MAKLWAPFYSAWEVLAFSAMVALLIVLAKRGGSAYPTCMAPLVVLAKGGGVALPTCLALLLVHTEA